MDWNIEICCKKTDHLQVQNNDTNFLIKINFALNTIIISEANGSLCIASY